MDGIKVTGKLIVELIKEGKVVQRSERDNIVTTLGKNALASLLNSTNAGNTWVTHMGFGTSATTVANTDLALGQELIIGGNNYNRVAVTRSNPSSNVIQYQASLTGLSAAYTIQEAGLFTAATSGTLVAHQLTGASTLSSSSDTLQITWQITIG